MVHTRPRFGGGSNMESQAFKKEFLPKKAGCFPLCPGTKEFHFETEYTLQTFSTKGPEEMSEAKSNKMEGCDSCNGKRSSSNPLKVKIGCFDIEQQESLLYDHQSEKDCASEDINNVAYSCQNRQLEPIECHSETLDNKVENISETVQSSATLLTYPVQKNSSSVTEHSPGPSQIADDVENLISLLGNLDIHVVVKEYDRAHSVTNAENDDDTMGRKSEAIGGISMRPIDLSVASINAKKTDTEIYQRNLINAHNGVVYCKNLFLKDRKSNFYLVIAEESATVDLKILKHQLKAARNLSFADAVATEEILGQKSGAINPFVALRKSTRNVRFILHQSLSGARNSRYKLAFHPLDGSLQVNVSLDELIVFLDYCAKRLEILPVGENANKDHIPDSKVKSPPESKSKKGTDGSKRENARKKGKEITEADQISQTNPYVHIANCELENVTPETSCLEKVSETDQATNLNAYCGTKQLDELCETEIDFEDTDDKMNPNALSEKHSQKCITLNNHDNDDQTTEHESKEPPALNHENLFSPQTGKSTHLKHFSRKGKLKSYLKKTNNGTQNSHQKPPEESDSSNRDSFQDADASKPVIDQKASQEKSSIMLTENDGHKQQLQYSPCETGHEEEQPVNVSSSILPEITQFYDSLSDLEVQYQEIYLPECTSRDIGPSLGCKCVFLKDRKCNFFLIITHEYYELDHGRLKQALKPKKKLDPTEPADVLDTLGVQPLRITPFSCTTDRAKSKSVKVFMTEKIIPSEVILCIQHPFADGRRLVTKSGEIQRYLSQFVPEIGTVKEKAWPDKFNWIFTRFTQQNLGQTISSSIPTPSAIESKDIVETEDHSNSDAEQFCHTREAEIHRDAQGIGSESFLVTVFKSVSRVCLGYTEVHFPVTAKQYCAESVDTYSIRTSQSSSTCDGSSVDQILTDIDVANDHGFGEKCQEKLAHNSADDRNQNHAKDYKGNNSSTNLKPEKPSFSGQCSESSEDASTVYLNRDPGTNTSLFNVEDVIHHLQNSEAEFVLNPTHENKLSDEEYSKALNYPHEKDLHPMLRLLPKEIPGSSFESPAPLLSAAEKQLSTQKASKEANNSEEEDKMKDRDNVETCNTLYLCDDKDNHYIIVGGEADYITKVRFRRRFGLRDRRFEACEVNVADLTTSPFSVAVALRRSEQRKRGDVFLVLYTSLYLDPDTLCVFDLDRKGTTVRMTSSELENYASKEGMEVWYMP